MCLHEMSILTILIISINYIKQNKTQHVKWTRHIFPKFVEKYVFFFIILNILVVKFA